MNECVQFTYTLGGSATICGQCDGHTFQLTPFNMQRAFLELQDRVPIPQRFTLYSPTEKMALQQGYYWVLDSSEAYTLRDGDLAIYTLPATKRGGRSSSFSAQPK